ncbi:hypothetical protein [Dialister succinatiphilus]|uniref:hypothetical protein n=1 Tax=Dialister succinatiphilus TaxID=487173 RepID=UPI00235701B8|nr:hypothetical protein [Dialister succinatiphilus]
MEIHLMSKEENEALDAFEMVQDEYIQKFGEDSLDTVILMNPSRIDVKEIQEATKKLQSAIKSGKPLPRIDPKVFERLEF